MTETYNIYDAKTHLSDLLKRTARGEEFVIAKAGKPLGRLVPMQENKAQKPERMPGLGKGRIWYSSDCWEPMGDDELKDWYGEDLPALESDK